MRLSSGSPTPPTLANQPLVKCSSSMSLAHTRQLASKRRWTVSDDRNVGERQATRLMW